MWVRVGGREHGSNMQTLSTRGVRQGLGSTTGHSLGWPSSGAFCSLLPSPVPGARTHGC